VIEQAIFLVVATIAIAAACGVVASRTVFVSALWLVLSFVGVAGLYVLAGAYFLAVVQVLVYVGAISVLVLFAVMLTRNVMAAESPFNRESVLAFMVVGGVFGLLAVVGYVADWPLTHGLLTPAAGVPVPAGTELGASAALAAPPMAGQADALPTLPDGVAMLGRSLMTEHLLAFEVMSVILLVALVGAIVIARD